MDTKPKRRNCLTYVISKLNSEPSDTTYDGPEWDEAGIRHQREDFYTAPLYPDLLVKMLNSKTTSIFKKVIIKPDISKIIFLDIDGVLNSEATISAGVYLDSGMVKHLNSIVEETGACIVVSSSWRITHSLENIQFALNQLGLEGEPIVDQTPQLNEAKQCRGKEVRKWLEANPDVKSYVIIDDDSDFLKAQKPYRVKTTFEQGLTKILADKAITILNTDKDQ